MAILEEAIQLKWSNSIKKYYIGKGYTFTRTGDIFIVHTDDLPTGSSFKVTKICDDCGKCIKNQVYSSILKNRNQDGKDRCKKCGAIYSGEVRKNNVKYVKSLDYYAKLNSKEYLLQEFSEKNNKLPKDISFGTNEIYLWNCPDCKSEYDMSVSNRKNRNCPFCRGSRVNETNCLWTTHSNIAMLLTYPERGYKITSGSNKKEKFTCPNCKHEESKVIQSVVNRGLSCSACSDGLSYPQKFMFNMLKQLNIKFENEKIFKWSKSVKHNNSKLIGLKRYDFYIPSLSMIIETHGGQHYSDGFQHLNGKNLEEEQENDRLKEKLAKENGIKDYIQIDCKRSELDYIRINILSKLSNLLNLKNIDWEDCHKFACSSLVNSVCGIWSEGIESTSQIMKLLNLSRATVIRYLKKGHIIGICSYDPKEEMRKAAEASRRKRINYNRNSRKVMQLSASGDNYIKEWISAEEISKNIKIHQNSIRRVCSGKRKTAGGYKWMYKEDYEEYIKQAAN
ncbi:zinc-ribbon domain-containing protein [Sporosarcina globispora]|uniref:zinc-ribbon domain-containing protein n=1 Tax=Sporosarcina globispora TaxID=1459 RepID=UPI0006A9E154|nr:zinc-ribbon domain-containing protein [Sporosarcina globispora]